MHRVLANGIVNVHIGLMMETLKTYRLTYKDLHDYLQVWRLPAQTGMKCGLDSCSEKRAASSNKEGSFKCQASEARSVLPIFAHYVSNTLCTCAVDEVKAQGELFMRLVDVIVYTEKNK